jgi:hypothetical protein
MVRPQTFQPGPDRFRWWLLDAWRRLLLADPR